MSAYRFCWWCSRRLWGKAHRVVFMPHGMDPVRVHAACAGKVMRAHRGAGPVTCTERSVSAVQRRQEGRSMGEHTWVVVTCPECLADRWVCEECACCRVRIKDGRRRETQLVYRAAGAAEWLTEEPPCQGGG